MPNLDDVEPFYPKVRERLWSELFGDFDLGRYDRASTVAVHPCVFKLFRSHSDDHLAALTAELATNAFRNWNLLTTEGNLAVCEKTMDEIHGRTPDEASHKCVRGVPVESLWRVNLLNH